MPSISGRRLSEAVPILRVLSVYHRPALASKLLAGISVCLVLIPSVIAYAELAGLTSIHGLSTALCGMIGNAIFASLPQVIAGPDAAIPLLVAGAVGPLAGDDPSRAATLAPITALLGGGLMFLAAWLRAGVVADFLSKPVLVGYLSGAALILMSTQLGKLFGFPLSEHEFFPLFAELLRRMRESHVLTLSLGLGLIVLLEVFRHYRLRVPGTLAVFVVALLASAVFDLCESTFNPCVHAAVEAFRK